MGTQYFSFRIQLISIILSLLFLVYISRLIIKGKLREEFAIFWIVCTTLLVLFSFWRQGLDLLAKLLGVYSPPNLVFLAAIFAILVYMIHLSTVISKLYEQNKKLAQEIALFKHYEEKNKVKEKDII